MKLHLPKQLFTALLASITLAAPAAWALSVEGADYGTTSTSISTDTTIAPSADTAYQFGERKKTLTGTASNSVYNIKLDGLETGDETYLNTIYAKTLLLNSGRYYVDNLSDIANAGDIYVNAQLQFAAAGMSSNNFILGSSSFEPEATGGLRNVGLRIGWWDRGSGINVLTGTVSVEEDTRILFQSKDNGSSGLNLTGTLKGSHNIQLDRYGRTNGTLIISGDCDTSNFTGVLDMDGDVTTTGSVTLALGRASVHLGGLTSNAAAAVKLYEGTTASELTLDVAEGKNLTYSGTIGSADSTGISLVKSGSGSQTLGGDVYLNGLTVNAGSLSITGTTTLTGTITMTGGSLDIDTLNITTTQEFTTSGDIAINIGTVNIAPANTLESSGAADDYYTHIYGETERADDGNGYRVQSGDFILFKGLAWDAEAWGELNVGDYGTVRSEDGNTLVTVSNAGTGLFYINNDATYTDANILGSHGVYLTQGKTLDLAIDDEQTLSTELTGEGSLKKSGTGTLALSGANTYSGGTTIAAGTLSITDAQSLGTGGVTVEGSAELEYAVSTESTVTALTLKSGAEVNTSSTGTLTATTAAATGAFTKNGTGTLVLSTVSQLDGTVTVNDGILQIGGGQRKLNSAQVNGGTLQLTGTDIINWGNSVNIEVLDGTLDLDARQSVDSATVITLDDGIIEGDGGTNRGYTVGLELHNTSTLTITSKGTSSISTNIGMRKENGNNGGTVNFAVTDGTLTVSGKIEKDEPTGATISGKVTKSGAGELILSGNNTYANGTTIGEGTVTTQHTNALGSGGVTMTGGKLNVAEGIGLVLGGALTAEDDSTLTLNNGSSLTLGAASTIAGTVSGAGNIASNYNTTFSGAVSEWTGSFTYGADMTLTFDGSANAVNAAITQNTGNLTLTVGTTADATFGGAVTANQINVNQNTTFNGAVTAANMKVAGSKTVTFAGGTEHEITTINPGSNANITYDVAAGASLEVLQDMWMSNSSITLENEASFSHAGQALKVIGTGNESSIGRDADGESRMYVGNTGYTISNAEVNMSNSDAATLGMKLTQSSLTTEGIGKLTVSNSLNTITNLAAESGDVELSASMDVDSISAKEGRTVTVTGGNTIDMGGGAVSIGTNGAETNATMTAMKDSALARLQEEASFTIQDMTLTNTTITAATPTTQVNFIDVTVEGATVLRNMQASMPDANVTTGGSEGVKGVFTASTSLLSGITLAAGSTITVDLGDLSCAYSMDQGKYNLSITLSGFTMKKHDTPGLLFAADSWLGKLLSAQDATDYVSGAVETPASVSEGGGVSVSYADGGANVGTIITIRGLNVPEPASATLGLAALMMLCARRRRND